jgi:hypothetical protein
MKELCTIIHFTNLNKIIFSILVIVSSLLMSIQFLSPMNIQEDFPIRMNSNDIKNEPYNPFSKYAYYQILKDTAKFSSLTNKFIIEPASTSNSQHNKFIIDLSILSQNNDYNGNVIFYVLYYPSLMKVTAKLDGTVFTPETDTFWFKTPELSEAQQYRYLGIHTLQLKNLPAQGILEVDTEFIGSALGNKISLISIFLLAGLGLIKLIRCRRQGAGQRPAPKGPELSPEPEKLL